MFATYCDCSSKSTAASSQYTAHEFMTMRSRSLRFKATLSEHQHSQNASWRFSPSAKVKAMRAASKPAKRWTALSRQTALDSSLMPDGRETADTSIHMVCQRPNLKCGCTDQRDTPYENQHRKGRRHGWLPKWLPTTAQQARSKQRAAAQHMPAARMHHADKALRITSPAMSHSHRLA